MLSSLIAQIKHAHASLILTKFPDICVIKTNVCISAYIGIQDWLVYSASSLLFTCFFFVSLTERCLYGNKLITRH